LLRDEYFNIVSKQSSGYYIGVDFMEQSPSAKLQFIVGDIGYAFNNAIGIFYVYDSRIYICLIYVYIFIMKPPLCIGGANRRGVGGASNYSY
jgi:hypothetical protein